MDGKKISELPSLSAIDGDDISPVVDISEDITKKSKMSDVLNYISSNMETTGGGSGTNLDLTWETLSSPVFNYNGIWSSIRVENSDINRGEALYYDESNQYYRLGISDPNHPATVIALENASYEEGGSSYKIIDALFFGYVYRRESDSDQYISYDSSPEMFVYCDSSTGEIRADTLGVTYVQKIGIYINDHSFVFNPWYKVVQQS